MINAFITMNILYTDNFNSDRRTQYSLYLCTCYKYIGYDSGKNNSLIAMDSLPIRRSVAVGHITEWTPVICVVVGTRLSIQTRSIKLYHLKQSKNDSFADDDNDQRLIINRKKLCVAAQ